MNYHAHDDNTLQQQGQPSHTLTDTTNEPMQNYDGTHMCNQNGELVYKSQFLSTHPLWSDCKERVGYAGKKFTYVSGDGVIRTMNAIFGHGAYGVLSIIYCCVFVLYMILQFLYELIFNLLLSLPTTTIHYTTQYTT